MRFNNNFLIFKALLKRDIEISILNFSSILIDSIVLSMCLILLFNYLLPTLGMTKQYTFPLFLGSIIIPIVSVSFSKAVNIKSDIEHKKVIDYHLTLPISKNWLIIEYIVSFAFELFLTSTISIFIGIIFLNDFNLFNFFYFLPIYILGLIFFSVFFLYFAFSTKLLWFISNFWERVLSIMIHLGCIHYLWFKLIKFSSFFGHLVLINPFTYVSEGFRSAFFDEGYIPIEFCCFMLTIFSFVFFLLFKRAFNKLMDPV